MDDPTWLIPWWICGNNLVLSKYAISSWSNTLLLRKWPKTMQIIQKYKIVIFGWSGFFPEKTPCTFLSRIELNIHAKKLRNPWRGFWEKLFTNRSSHGWWTPSLTSTDVENSSSLWAYILRTRPLIDMRFSQELRWHLVQSNKMFQLLPTFAHLSH